MRFESRQYSMRTVYLFLLMIFYSLTSFAQEKSDQVEKHFGTTLNSSILVSQSSVAFAASGFYYSNNMKNILFYVKIILFHTSSDAAVFLTRCSS